VEKRRWKHSSNQFSSGIFKTISETVVGKLQLIANFFSKITPNPTF
jgi:hypothetical protein